MPENNEKHQSIDTILVGMSKDINYIVKSIDSIEKKLESKVDFADFSRLEKVLDDHKKDSDAKHKETTDKVNSHAVKLGIGGALLTAGSWLLSLIR